MSARSDTARLDTFTSATSLKDMRTVGSDSNGDKLHLRATNFDRVCKTPAFPSTPFEVEKFRPYKRNSPPFHLMTQPEEMCGTLLSIRRGKSPVDHMSAASVIFTGYSSGVTGYSSGVSVGEQNHITSMN